MKDTVSIEYAKKLHKAGIEIDCAMVWHFKLLVGKYWVIPKSELPDEGTIGDVSEQEPNYLAPMLHELLPYMPKVIYGKDDRGEFSFYLSIDDDNFIAGYFDNCLQEWFKGKSISDANPADACAELLLWTKNNVEVDLDE